MNKVTEIVNQYLSEFETIYNDTLYIVSLVEFDKRLQETVFNNGIMNLCIKYESFTSDVYEIISRDQVSYNKPWQYTRDIYKYFYINDFKEYDDARAIWKYYNALKHSNDVTKKRLLFLKEKYINYHGEELLKYVYQKLIDILEKIKNHSFVKK